MDIAIIFIAQVVYVSIMTLRWIMLMKGNRRIASLISFVEVMLWVYALGLVMQDIGSPLRIAAYAGGYAAGTGLGSWLEERLAYGYSLALIVAGEGTRLPTTLRSRGFAVTAWPGSGQNLQREVLLVLFRRRFTQTLHRTLEQTEPQAFVTFLEPRMVKGGFLSKRLPIPTAAEEILATVLDTLDHSQEETG